MLTLWDLIEPVVQRLRPRPKRPPEVVVAPMTDRSTPEALNRSAMKPPTRPVNTLTKTAKTRSKLAKAGSAQEQYDRVTQEMLARYSVRVRRWRKAMSGMAWQVLYRDGTVANLIEAPRPKGPMSAAVFLHEIGHHAIGFDRYKPRCLEEYHAWRWSLEAMEASGLNITDAVRHRMHESLWYAVSKAKRRGIRNIPPELLPFMERPPRRRAARSD